MKKVLMLTLAFVGATATASAVHLFNKGGPQDLVIKCVSTSHVSMGGNSTRDLGAGPCTVTVKATGSSATASGSTDLVIDTSGNISTK